MRFAQLFENTNILYHGDNVGTTRLDPKWMIHGNSNNQEGVGIYFSPDIDVAKAYGPKISVINRAGLNIVNSRDIVADIVPDHAAVEFLNYLNNTNDDFWYILTDYGIEVMEPDDVTEEHLYALHQIMKNEEIRNWQIELAETSLNNSFVEGWNRYIKIDGMYEEVSQFYSIINPAIPVRPYNF